MQVRAMLPAQFPRPFRIGLFALATTILLAMCVLPQRNLPDAGLGDKSEHAIAWFVLTTTGYLLAPNRRWAIPGFAFAFGVVIELLQANMGYGRHGDWRDLVMDTLGIAAAVLLFVGWTRLSRR